jgi:signal transduction histidine kinase
VKKGTKLLLSYAALTLVGSAGAYMAYRNVTAAAEAAHQVWGVDYVRSRDLAVVNEAQTDVARAIHGLANRSTSLERRRQLLAETEAAFERASVSWNRYEALPRTADEDRLWQALARPWGEWRQASERFLELTTARARVQAAGVTRNDPRYKSARGLELQALVAMEAPYSATDHIIRDLDELTASLVERTGHGGEQQGRRAAALLLVGFVGALLCAIGIGAMTRQQLESHAQLRALASHLQRIREEEKTRIARDLHDDLGQLLTGLKMDLAWIEGQLEAMPPGPEVNALLDRTLAAGDLSDETIAHVQRIAAELRPAALDRLGLSAALQQEARRFRERTGIRCTTTTPELLPPHSPDVATALYRIAQEALTNVARHARASEVTIELTVADAALLLTIEDDGVGFDAGARAGSLGLLGMSERASLVHGQLEVGRRAPRGTTVSARAPLAAAGTSIAIDAMEVHA